MSVDFLVGKEELQQLFPDIEITLSIARIIKGDPFTYSDFTAEQIASLKQPAVDAGNEVKEADLLRGKAFDAKILEVSNALQAALDANGLTFNKFINSADTHLAEMLTAGREATSSIVALDNAVTENERNRIQNEENRSLTEQQRATAELDRDAAEQLRTNAELDRKQEEDIRAQDEATRLSAENTRSLNENIRSENERARIAAETSRDSAEELRASAELDRATAERNRTTVEAQRVNAELNRAATEKLRISAETARDTAEKKRAIDTAKAITDTNVAKDAAQEVVDNNVAALAGKADLGGDGFVVLEQIDLLQGLQRYISTPAAYTAVRYEGFLTDIGSNDFTIEVILNFENSGGTTQPILNIGGLTPNFPNTGKGFFLYNTILGRNNFSNIAFPSPTNAGENFIKINKVFPINTIVKCIICRYDRTAFAIINGIKREVQHDRVIDIGSSISITCAKKIVLLRKFNFANEDFARKLCNNGRWWDVAIDGVFRNPKSSLQNIFESDGTFTDGVMSGCTKWGFADKNIFSKISNERGDFQRIERGGTYFCATNLRTNAIIYANKKYCISGWFKLPKLSSSSYLMLQQHQSQMLTSLLPNDYSGDEYIYVNKVFSYKDNLGISSSLIQLRVVASKGSPVDYLEFKDIKITECALEDEFLPQSFTHSGAINTASGDNLVAIGGDKITFGYDNYANDELVGYPLSTIPDFVGQKLITVPANSSTKGDVYVCGAPADGEELSARLWTKINV